MAEQEQEKNQSQQATDAGGKKGGSKQAEQEPPIEEKPFAEFIEQHFIPAVKDALSKEGIPDLELWLQTDQFPLGDQQTCSQVVGQWDGGNRRFTLYFLEDDIKGQKAFCYSASDAPPSTIESFMIDEKKVNLELLVMYTVQRLNGQKWLSLN